MDALDRVLPLRILTVVDQYTRECLCARADRSQSGEKVSEQLERVIALRGAPESITSDNGSEFAGQVMDHWAHQVGVKLDFIRVPRQNSVRLRFQQDTAFSSTSGML